MSLLLLVNSLSCPAVELHDLDEILSVEAPERWRISSNTINTTTVTTSTTTNNNNNNNNNSINNNSSNRDTLGRST